MILKEGGVVNRPNPYDGRTALHYAVERNSPNLVTLLLNHSATKDVIDAFGRTPLQLAHHLHFDKVSPRKQFPLARSLPFSLSLSFGVCFLTHYVKRLSTYWNTTSLLIPNRRRRPPEEGGVLSTRKTKMDPQHRQRKKTTHSSPAD